MPKRSKHETLSLATKMRIYSIWQRESLEQSALAERFGVSQSMISYIIKEQENAQHAAK